MAFSVLSWNILGPATRDVEDFGFIKNDYGRLGKSLEIINNFEADILCFQEVDLQSLHLFNNFLLGQYAQVAYHEKGSHGGVVLYIKKSKFTVGDTLSSVLKNSASDAPGAFCGAIIQSIETKNSFFVASVHLSKSSHQQAISEGIYQVSDLCRRLGKNLPDTIILAGDFNTMYNDMKEAILPHMSQGLEKKIIMFEHESCTSNSPQGEFKSIDHVLYTGFHINFQKSCVASTQYHHIDRKDLKESMSHGHVVMIHNELPSDHAPLFAVFE